MKRAALLLAMTAMLSSPAQSQDGKSVHGEWKAMKTAVFDWSEIPSTASADDRAILQKLWVKELAARHITASGYLPGIALIGDVREGSKRIVFSMFGAGGIDSCDPPPNGASARDIYQECRMRVASWPTGEHGTPLVVNLPGYCMVFDISNTDSRTEYRYEKHAQTVHFRTIQFGKVVPNCSRSLKLG